MAIFNRRALFLLATPDTGGSTKQNEAIRRRRRLCYSCRNSLLRPIRKLKKQRVLEVKEWIRNSGFDKNRNVVLSSIERRRWERAMRERMLELERQYGSKDDTNDKKSDCNKGGGNNK